MKLDQKKWSSGLTSKNSMQSGLSRVIADSARLFRAASLASSTACLVMRVMRGLDARKQ